MSWVTKSAFTDIYPMIRKTIGEYFTKQLPSRRADKWIDRVLDYNIPHGKLNRGLALVHAFQCLNPRASQSDIVVAVRLGWVMELLQSCFLVADDIMDSSLTRRGRPCWYKMPDVGLKAVNDTLLLENSIYIVVKDAVCEEKMRNDLLSVIAEAKLNTVLGQHLDSEPGPLIHRSAELYSDIVRLKTSHYSFYLPVALALTLAGTNTTDAPSELQRLCYDIGYYFQVQDDYLDCFGDSSITGKEGTDIQDDKCTWLLINALTSIDRNGREWRLIEENYGKHDAECVNRVKKLYTDLRLKQTYERFETEAVAKLKDQINSFPIVSLTPLFTSIVADLHQRQK